MSQIIDIYVRELSTPVDTLALSPRTCRSLQRAGITTVAEILLAGKPKLGSAKGVGAIRIKEVWRATASCLDLSEDQLLEVAPQLERAGREAGKCSIKVLPLKASTLQDLWSLNIRQVDSLIRFRTYGYDKLLPLGAIEVAEINQALYTHMTQSALTQLMPCIQTLDTPDPALADNMSFTPPELRLHLPGLREQSWSMLALATMQLLELDDIGAQAGGISRKRVYQIIKEAQVKLHHHLEDLSLFLDHLEGQSKKIEKDLDHIPLDLKKLVSALLPDPAKSNLAIEAQDLGRLILLIRSLVIYRNVWFLDAMESRWGTFIQLSCLVAPELQEYGQFRRMFKELKPIERKNRYTDMVVSILSQAGQPMHWSGIALQASMIDRSETFSAQALLEHVAGNQEQFIRVGPGTYGLAKWGNQATEPYDDMIAFVLCQAGRPMTLEQIFDKVSEIRPADWSSIGRSLNEQECFYRSIENTYGLRTWLIMPDGQSQPRPIGLIEDPKSRLRVACSGHVPANG